MVIRRSIHCGISYFPFDENLQLKIQEKIDKYDHLRQELKRKKSKALEEQAKHH